MRKRISVLLAITVLAVGLGGCKKKVEEGPTKEELALSLNQANAQIQSLTNELQGTKEVLATYNPNLSDVDLSAITLLPTNQLAYNAINGKIRLSNQLDMSPSVPVPNTTQITLGGDIKYVPSNNWTFELSNNVLRLQHRNGMIVNLNIYKYVGSSTQYDVMDTLIRPYLNSLSVTEDTAKKMFINNKVVGGIITSDMKVKTYDNSDVVEEYVPETVAETQPVVEESLTDESGDGTQAEGAESSTDETVMETLDSGETVAYNVLSPEFRPLSGFGTLDEVESTAGEGTDSESTESESVSSEVSESTVAVETRSTETVENVDYNIEDYKYILGVLFSGDYALTIEAFYANDDNASIQEELFNACLGSIQVNGNKLVTE